MVSVGDQNNPSEDEDEGDHNEAVRFFGHIIFLPFYKKGKPPRWSGLRALRKEKGGIVERYDNSQDRKVK